MVGSLKKIWADSWGPRLSTFAEHDSSVTGLSFEYDSGDFANVGR